MNKINFGCGDDYKEGYINTDCRNNIKKDIFVDLNKTPYPFEDNTFEEILIRNVLEHIDNPISMLKECIRIGKKECKIIIQVPHSTSYVNDASMQHKARFNEKTFLKHQIKEYELEELELIDTEFIYTNKWKKFIPFKNYLKFFINGLFDDIKFTLIIKK